MSRTCSRCHATLEPDARFCGDCGTPVVEPPRPAPVAAPATAPAPVRAGAPWQRRVAMALLTGAIIVVAAMWAPDSVVQYLPAPIPGAVGMLRSWMPRGSGDAAAPGATDAPTPPAPGPADDVTTPSPQDGQSTAFDAQMAENAQIFVEGEIGDFIQEMDVSGAAFLETPPQLLHRVSPVYPEESRQRGVEGTVLLLVFVDPQGNVVSAAAIDGPDEATQAAAEDAVQQWRYAPPGGDEPLVAFEVQVEFGRGQR